ncbi:hypothetical protein M3Y98_00127100 [Aphelenchoides besseyi]|nr:hypothetical protein M3Y98_00127100 [Aphelenchoides besseyi]KAI6199574.1 hypothetical protein M3Y96_00641400 [Aphelenchoides besseyi]
MARSQRRSKAQVVAPPQNETVEAPEQQNEGAEANRVEFGFNSGFVGLGEGLNVEPKILVVDPKRTRKGIVYISNISNGRQYFKLYSTYAKNFRIRNYSVLEPGQTVAQEIGFRSFEFEDENDITISVYHSRVKQTNLREQHDNRHIVVVKLLKASDTKKLKEESVSQSTSSVVHPEPRVRRRRTEDGKEVIEMNAPTPELKRRTEGDDLDDL